MDDKPSKERLEIPRPAPVTLGAVRYQAVPFGKARGLGQNGGLVAAVDALTGIELWVLPVYTLHHNPEMEGDKQDIHIARLSAQGDHQLRVEAERGHGTWLVDVLKRTATKVAP